MEARGWHELMSKNLFERVLKVTVFTSVNRLDLLIDTYCIVVP